MPTTDFEHTVHHRFERGDILKYVGESRVCISHYNRTGITIEGIVLNDYMKASYLYSFPGQMPVTDPVSFIDGNFEKDYG